ncbi:hypothetical protein LguiB_011696 [Lonicera macranthoides]
MLLKTSISSTKRFFKKTIQSFKSLLSNGYQKLPKSPSFNQFSCTEKNLGQKYREMDTFYTEFTNQWDRDKEKAAVKRNESKILISTRTNEMHYENSMEYAKVDSINEKKGVIGKEMKRRGNDQFFSTSGASRRVVREERGYLITRKLRELEMMDLSNVEHVLDIEEILHYYSRLTCPAYLDIVDNFFMEMYSEIINLKASTKF